MTTRRELLRLAGAVPAAGLLAACTPRSAVTPEPVPRAPGTLLQVETTSGLAYVDTQGGRLVAGPLRGVSSWDGSLVATTTLVPESAGRRSRLSVLDADGRARVDVVLDGHLAPRVVSPTGDLVALVESAAADDAVGVATPYRPAGRASTTIVVAGRAGETHRVTVPGCVEPEAFAATGDVLFVLDYDPPLAPEQYRVRMLYLASGTVQPMLTRDKSVVPADAEERMRGVGRQAVHSSSAQLLFTLYTHQPDHEHTRDLISGARDDAPHVHAFVHSLSLDQSYAYCIDLPGPFGDGPAGSHAIAISARGRNPIVVDTGAGAVARLDGTALTVVLTASLQVSAAGPASVAVAPTDQIAFIGTGNQVQLIRTPTLTPVVTWSVDGPVRGLAASRTGDRLWVGQPGGAVALDASSGQPVGWVAVAGFTAVRTML